ncbi:MAG: ECF-type sigma factor [Acidobacteriota bacterium]|nr:ECF-type sigma factor [Acidobacteriota bacterium]
MEDKEILAEVTLMLQEWGESGDSNSLERLLPAVYSDLRALAGHHFTTEKEQTLCATALVNEVYLRMAGSEKITFKDREHFFCIAGRMMRRILVEHARKRLTQKRGGHMKMTLNEETDFPVINNLDISTLITLNDALDNLVKDYPRAAQILEWRIFAGLNNSEIAKTSGLSLATVKREWAMAKQRLFLHMNRR